MGRSKLGEKKKRRVVLFLPGDVVDWLESLPRKERSTRAEALFRGAMPAPVEVDKDDARPRAAKKRGGK